MELAGRKGIQEIDPDHKVDLETYADPDSEPYRSMVECIGRQLNLTTLKYQRLDDLVKAIGLPKEKLCTYCWDGKSEG